MGCLCGSGISRQGQGVGPWTPNDAPHQVPGGTAATRRVLAHRTPGGSGTWEEPHQVDGTEKPPMAPVPDLDGARAPGANLVDTAMGNDLRQASLPGGFSAA
jgi:hypothetical protein